MSGLDTLLVALLPGHRCAALHRDLGTAGGSRGPGDLEIVIVMMGTLGIIPTW